MGLLLNHDARLRHHQLEAATSPPQQSVTITLVLLPLDTVYNCRQTDDRCENQAIQACIVNHQHLKFVTFPPASSTSTLLLWSALSLSARTHPAARTYTQEARGKE